MNYWECGVEGCTYKFPDDRLIYSRKAQHNIWHGKANIQKRNAIQGITEWKLVDEFGEEVCQECNGEGFVEYAMGVDDSILSGCERCNPDGGDLDRAYDEWRDRQAEHRMLIEEAMD